ncbi:hypothetical protein [Bosea lathyri]|uniref:Uncharacterized protein n=1 Tax=Bosea lathyri TaxID=1036778 RepID=A0A1H6CVY9_9HYPH|nr:hypothetical protein [Bosea lathyri]SEG76863.1 hypothetical protein SAMN04488115_112161 [Bosea lathyri]
MKTTIERGPESCRSDPPAFTIETVEDYELAIRRIKALSVQDGSSYRESVALKDAIRIWETEHAGATGPERSA